VIAGIWLIAAELLPPERLRTFRRVVAGVLLAPAGALLIVATHWCRFG
jgi:hypothetical protein